MTMFKKVPLFLFSALAVFGIYQAQDEVHARRLVAHVRRHGTTQLPSGLHRLRAPDGGRAYEEEKELCGVCAPCAEPMCGPRRLDVTLRPRALLSPCGVPAP